MTASPVPFCWHCSNPLGEAYAIVCADGYPHRVHFGCKATVEKEQKRITAKLPVRLYHRPQDGFRIMVMVAKR